MQVGEGGPLGPHMRDPASPHCREHLFSVFPDGRHRLRRSKPAQQAQASLSVQLGFPESMSEGLVGAPVLCPPTHV